MIIWLIKLTKLDLVPNSYQKISSISGIFVYSYHLAKMISFSVFLYPEVTFSRFNCKIISHLTKQLIEQNILFLIMFQIMSHYFFLKQFFIYSTNLDFGCEIIFPSSSSESKVESFYECQPKIRSKNTIEKIEIQTKINV